MCGLAGYFRMHNNTEPISEQLLHAMQQEIAHRGPDGSGIWHNHEQGIGLAHRRLSIIDLSDAGAQPMYRAEQNVVMSYNGEIYNHRTLRAELEQLGYQYQSHTDTETILYAYDAWGMDMLHRFEGMFAFALYDLQKRILFLVRDRIGIKPLYFSLQGEYCSFASEIKALWKLPWIQREISAHAVSHYLSFLTTPAPITLYDKIYKLPAGFYAQVTTATISFHEWYNPIQIPDAHENALLQSEEYCIEQLQHLMRAAVRKRLMSDVPFGVFLSGGVDSSIITALMAQETSQVKTFTIAFSDGPEYDELSHARRIAQMFGTDHHEMVINEYDAHDLMQQRMTFYQDEPLGDCVCVPLYYVSQLLKNSGVTVALVGEGADELFCGYSQYAKTLDVYPRWRMLQKLPSFMKHSAAYLARTTQGKHTTQVDMMQRLADNEDLFMGGALVFTQTCKNKLLRAATTIDRDPIVQAIYPGLDLSASSYAIAHYHRSRLLHTDPHADTLKQMTYIELKYRLSELLLMRVDKMTMAHGVEARVPFLDHAVVEFALKVPTQFKYANGIPKSIVKKAYESLLPYDLLYRKKMGFAAPITRWFTQQNTIAGAFRTALNNHTDSWSDLIDIQHAQQMLEKNTTKRDYSYHLWALYNLLMYERSQ